MENSNRMIGMATIIDKVLYFDKSHDTSNF